jgi:hypothetical protein
MDPRDVISTPHVHEDELHSYTLSGLSDAPANALEGHVSHRPQCKGNLGGTTQFTSDLLNLDRATRGSDKRSQRRFQTSNTGFLRSLSPLLLDRWSVQIIDVSKDGLGLLLPIELSPGTLVQVQIDNTLALGEVRHSKRIGEHEFRTGLRLNAVLRLKK